jgi:predicted RND superfamily exporter protein
MSASSRDSKMVTAGLCIATLVCGWLTFAKLTISTDLSTLFPASGAAAALARWTRAFGGRDPVVVLVRGTRPDDVASVAEGVARGLRSAPSIVRVLDRAPMPQPIGDPTLAWAFAGPVARARLAAVVTPRGMRDRLQDTRTLLLSPASDARLQSWLLADPLRLWQLPWETAPELAAAVAAPAGSVFAADQGRARLILAEARGSPFRSADAKAVTEDVERVVGQEGRGGVTCEIAGGHAIGWATERLLKRDMEVSGLLSLVLASLAFVATFGRLRALAAVLPPLVIGTLWTTGLAALLPTGLNAIAIAFAAVVVGVGVDTGVHVYAALLDARRQGLEGAEAAAEARRATWRPTLTAALVAAAAFGSLALSGLRAMQELGALCGAGEFLTAVAILLVTPEIGTRIESKVPPPRAQPPWIRWLDEMTSTRPRAFGALAICASPLVVIAVFGWPPVADALVAVRPKSLAPLVAEDDVRALFGGKREQWIVLSTDAQEDACRLRADRIAEALEPLAREHVIGGFDSLTTLAPSPEMQAERLKEREALDLPARTAELESALRDVGFDVAAFAPALVRFAHPSVDLLPDPLEGTEAGSWALARHVARDGPVTMVATYVRPSGVPSDDEKARRAIAQADPDAAITGFDAIDRALRDSLGKDIVRVGAAALLIVVVALRLALRSARNTVIALATLACEMAGVGAAMRVLALRWHVYDALVIPVLFGVTVDESMFLLHAAERHSMREALQSQGPLVAATGLTTAAGFGALVACRFDGLRDLGEIGAIGVLVGLVAALVVVPAAARITGVREHPV